MMDALLAPAALTQRRPSRVPFLLLGVLSPLLLFALALWFSIQTEHLQAMRNVIRASFEKRIVTSELLRELSDAEAAERGYIITGDPAMLRTFDLSRLNVASDLARLDELYGGEPIQIQRIARLQLMLAARFSEMTETIHHRGQSAMLEVRARLSDAENLRAVGEARSIVTALIAGEEGTLAERIQLIHDRNLSLRRFVWTLNLMISVVLMLALWALWRSRLKQYRVELEAHDAAARLRAIFASTTDAIMILNPQGMIEAINAATTRILGYGPAELVNRDASALLDVMDGEGHFHARVGLVDGRLEQTGWLDRTVRHRDGHSVPVDIGLGLMPLPGELHIVAAIRDISERKAVERLKDEFVATVSHELRTPLTSVVGSLGLLRAGSVGELPDAAHRLVEIAENNSRRLIRLINDILDIEKISSGRMRFERELVDLVAMAERAIEGSRGLADTKRVRLALSASERPIIVQGDEERLLQVVTNLLSNAIRFSPEGSEVGVSLLAVDGTAQLAVEDEGPGIPSEFHDRIFERFAQARHATVRGGASAAAAGGGTGLGLAISREIMAAHGGRIWFGSADGGGARLTCSLPLARRAAIPGKRHGRARILLCEPQDEAAGALRAVLEEEGHLVDRVATGGEAEENMRSGRYDVMLIEMLLPDDDGLETVRALRRDPVTRALPVIVVSGVGATQGGEEDVRLTLDLVDWLDKPLDPDRLRQAIGRAVSHAAADRPTLLHIEDDPDVQEVTAMALADQGRVLSAASLAAARALLAIHVPDIVILDFNLPDGSGLDLLPELSAADGTAIPTIIYSAEDVGPEVRDRVDAVLIKSRRSLTSLAHTIRQILAGEPVKVASL
jgi:PAS domain S-box-containing protein